MILTLTKSFERSLKKSSESEQVKQAVERLILALERDQKPHGLGLKKMREELWEIRAGLATRVLFALLPGEIRLLLAGDHEQVKRYLRRD